MDKIGILITSISAVVAAILGVLLTVWVKRSKPWLGVTSINRDDRHLVPVGEQLRLLVNNCRWVHSGIREHTPLQRLVEVYNDAEWGIDCCKDSLDKIGRFAKAIEEGFGSETQKREALKSFLKNDIIIQVLSAITRRGLLALPDHLDIDPNAKPLLLGDDLTKPEMEEKGFLLYAEDERVFLRAGPGTVGREILKRFKVLGEVFQYFVDQYIPVVLEGLKVHIQKDLQSVLEIKERLGDTIKSRKLVVRAQIANLGGSPEQIEPFGVLKLSSGGKPVEAVLVAVRDFRVYEAGMESVPRMVQLVEGMANKAGVESARTAPDDESGPGYIVAKPGDIVQVELTTLTPIEDSSVLDALEAGMLGCKLILRRANRGVRKWLVSNSIVLGEAVNQERENELRRIASR